MKKIKCKFIFKKNKGIARNREIQKVLVFQTLQVPS